MILIIELDKLSINKSHSRLIAELIRINPL